MTDEVEDAEVIEGEQEDVVEAEVETTEEDTVKPSESSTENESKSEEKPKEDGVQKRIDELTRLRRETERERDYWKEQAAKVPEAKPEPVEVKTLEDFDFDEKAYAAHLIEVASANATLAARQALESERKQSEAMTRERSFRSKEEAFAKEVPDYYQIAYSSPFINETVGEEIKDMENGPAVALYLARNDDIAEQISKMSPNRVARELGKIELKLSKETKSSSTAPPPPPKIKGGDPVISKKPEEMTQREFNEYRRKVIAKRGR